MKKIHQTAVLALGSTLILGACAMKPAPQANAASTTPPAAAPSQGGLSRVMVGRADLSVPGREAVIARVEVAPGAKAGRHTHPGEEISYIMEGEALLLIDGQPPRRVKAGESFVIPAGVVHDAHNDTNTPTKLVGVFVVEKGKPLATPAR
jgi:quercetin dioxygenase-like cupin family protein